MLSKPVLGRLDQGTIFTCGLAEDYSDCRTLGLIITARCDIAQEKAPIFNYLPVVSVNDWLHRDGRLILCDRLSRMVLGSMKNVLKSAGHSVSILETETPESVLEKLFPTGERSPKKYRDQLERLIGQKNLIERCEASKPSEGKMAELGAAFVGERGSLINELTAQRLGGYYFLPTAEHGGDNLGHVALLREVRHIPRSLAMSIGEGITKQEYEEASKTYPDYLNRLAFSSDDFSMPVGQVTSPHLEHLMQCFSVLFSRIGLTDLPRDYVNALWEMQPSVRRG